jgi:hypothetical protein
MPGKSIDKLSDLGFVMPDASLEQALQEAEALKEEISSRQAVEKYGQEAVEDAYMALARHVERNGPDDPVYVRIMGADDPYGDLVKWRRMKAKASRAKRKEAA